MTSTANEHDSVDDVEEANEGVGAITLGLYISAARCILTYIVAPVLGGFGHALPVVGQVLQTLGAVVSIAGAWRLWVVRNRWRYAYAAIAAAVAVVAVTAFIHP